MMQSFGSYSWFGSPMMYGLGGLGIVLISILAIVVIALKGYALWHAAKRDEKWWFIALLVLNTVGILELIYLIFIVKKWNLGGKSGTMSTNETGSTGTNSGNGPQAN